MAEEAALKTEEEIRNLSKEDFYDYVETAPDSRLFVKELLDRYLEEDYPTLLLGTCAGGEDDTSWFAEYTLKGNARPGLRATDVQMEMAYTFLYYIKRQDFVDAGHEEFFQGYMELFKDLIQKLEAGENPEGEEDSV